jgi:hypothetical protein
MFRRSAALVLVVAVTPAYLLGLAGCGGGSSPAAPAPVAAASPTPAPTPTPSPTATATPCADGCEIWDNHSPVADVLLKVYMLFNAKRELIQMKPDHYKGKITDPIKVGWMVRMDVTGKDKDGYQTFGKYGKIEWFYDESMVTTVIRSDWQRDLWVLKEGEFVIYVVFDGQGSNDLTMTFVQ